MFVLKKIPHLCILTTGVQREGGETGIGMQNKMVSKTEKKNIWTEKKKGEGPPPSDSGLLHTQQAVPVLISLLLGTGITDSSTVGTSARVMGDNT